MCTGVAVLVYVLVRRGLQNSISNALTPVAHATISAPKDGVTKALPVTAASGAPHLSAVPVTTVDAASRAALEELWTTSWIVLTLFAALSVFLAWWLAGRVLRPVAAITAAARRLSAPNLHERIALKGRSGELQRLADTFDEMAERIENLVAAQQRFAANAAHELRTNLAVQRAAAEIGLADPDPQRIELVRRTLLESARDCEALMESLLLMATAAQRCCASTRPA